MSIAAEIERRMRALGKNPTSLARLGNLDEDAVRNIMRGKSKNPRADTLAGIARALGCSVADLTGEKTVSPQPDLPPAYNGALSPGAIEIAGTEFLSVGRYDAGLSAGPGSLVDPNVEPLGYALFESQWLRAVTRAAPDHLAIVRVDGDSMETTLHDGDWVLVDRSQQSLVREGIYALRVGDVAWVKRITLNLRDRLVRMISDNPAYPVQDLTEDELAPIGRVVWIVGRRV